MEEIKYDDLFFNVLRQERNLVPFLNAVFGFLFRRTDFYCIQEDPKGKLGFPEGVAERIVRDVYRKWEAAARPSIPIADQYEEVPDLSQLVVREIEIETTPCLDLFAERPPEPDSTTSVRNEETFSDTFNGADRGNYRWSQSLQDIDIEIPVPYYIMKACDVRVDVRTQKLVVYIRDTHFGWKCLVDEELAHRNLKEDSIWSLVPGKHISVHLEKFEDRWWHSLLITEPEIDPTTIETVRSMTELGQEDKMKIEELMCNEQRKRKGLPTVEQTEITSLLREAWNIEGSPFRGTPFNPRVIKNNPSQNL